MTRRSKALEEGEVKEELRPPARKRPGAQEALKERQVGQPGITPYHRFMEDGKKKSWLPKDS